MYGVQHFCTRCSVNLINSAVFPHCPEAKRETMVNLTRTGRGEKGKEWNLSLLLRSFMLAGTGQCGSATSILQTPCSSPSRLASLPNYLKPSASMHIESTGTKNKAKSIAIQHCYNELLLLTPFLFWWYLLRYENCQR